MPRSPSADVRLLVATDQWSPDIVGGSARVATATARLLAERGHDVRVVSPRAAGEPELELAGPLELHRSLRRTPLPQTFADPLDAWRCGRSLREWPDVVLAHQATVAAGLLAARVRAPLAVVFHASAVLEQRFLRTRLPLPQRATSWALHPSLALLERAAVRGAATILVLSEFSRSLVLSRHPSVADRIVLVRGGVDADTFRPVSGRAELRVRLGIPVDDLCVLSVRRLEPRMGLEELLRATRLLVDRGLSVSLGIAGAGPLDGSLRQLAEDLGLAAAVRFFGRVPDAELPQLYAAADLFVLPTVAYEGFGMATLEALASGTPVVATRVGATPELLDPLEPRLLARGETAEDLADSIAGVVESLDQPLRDRCAAYARERFDWRVVIDDWEAALARVASRRRAT